MATLTNQTEIEGEFAAVVLAEYDDANSEWTRKVLGMTNRGDINVSVDESNESFSLSTMRRDKRYRVSNTIDIEFSSVFASDLEAAEALGIVDPNGKIDFSTDSRRFTIADPSTPADGDEVIEIAYFKDEPDFSSIDIEADSELLNRFEDVKIVLDDIAAGEIPPMFSCVGWCEGGFHLDYSSA